MYMKLNNSKIHSCKRCKTSFLWPFGIRCLEQENGLAWRMTVKRPGVGPGNYPDLSIYLSIFPGGGIWLCKESGADASRWIHRRGATEWLTPGEKHWSNSEESAIAIEGLHKIFLLHGPLTPYACIFYPLMRIIWIGFQRTLNLE